MKWYEMLFQTFPRNIKFQLQNFKYKVLDLEKKLIDVQIELAAERRKANPLLK